MYTISDNKHSVILRGVTLAGFDCIYSKYLLCLVMTVVTNEQCKMKMVNKDFSNSDNDQVCITVMYKSTV